MARGTKIILTLKQDMKEYLEERKLKELVARYSEFINFPIYVWTKKEVSKEVEIDDEEAAQLDEEKKAEEDDEPVKVVNDEDENNDPV